jgi:hypothetical protein
VNALWAYLSLVISQPLMKMLLLFVSIFISLAAWASTAIAQPVKMWEVKLSNTQYQYVGLRASGHDGSAVFYTTTPYDWTVKAAFVWVSSDGKQVNDLAASWDQNAVVLFVTSQQLLTQVGVGQPGAGVHSFFSRTGGMVVKQSFAVPGTMVFRPSSDYAINGIDSQPVVFYSTRVASDGTYLTQWGFQGLSSSTTLDLRAGPNGKLILSATSPTEASLESSQDLKTWALLTNFTGQVEVPIDQRQKGDEFFRSR